MKDDLGRHLIAEMVVFLCLLYREGATAKELETHMSVFNNMKPVTQCAVGRWLEGRTHPDVSMDVGDELLETQEHVAVLWCSLEHYLDIRTDFGHLERDTRSGRYLVTPKGKVYFDARRKALEIHRLVTQKNVHKQPA